MPSIINKDIKKPEAKVEEKILYSFVDFTHELLTNKDLDSALLNGITMLGKATQVDRVYYWENHFDEETQRWLTSQKVEWCAQGIEPTIDDADLQNIPLEELSDFMDILKEKKFFSSHIKDMLNGKNKTKDVLESQGIKSILALPVFIKDNFRGFVGFDSCKKEKEWSHSETSLLKAFVLLYVDALERSFLEASIIQAKENFNNFFNMIDDLLFVLDLDGNILQVNHKTLNRFKYSQEELIGKSVLILHPKNLADQVKRNIEDLFNKKVNVCNLPAITKEGQVLFVETRVSEGEWDGKPVLFAVSKDISELKMSEEKFSKAFNNSGVSMFIAGIKNGELLTINDNFLKLMGYTREEMEGKSILDFPIFDNPNDYYFIKQSLLKDKEVSNYEIKLKNKDNTPLAGLINIVPLRLNQEECVLASIVDITERMAYQEKLIEMSNRDSLTGVYTRRYVYEKLEKIIHQYKKDKNLFSVVVIDIDHFKAVNDKYGHQVGDKVLIEFTNRIEDNLLSDDLLGRYGGEEFILVLNHSNREAINVLLERVLIDFRNSPFVLEDICIHLTFSAGISSADELERDDISTERLVELADKRMYIGKQSGRNRIIYKTTV